MSQQQSEEDRLLGIIPMSLVSSILNFGKEKPVSEDNCDADADAR
jgi:hypothetical protein